MDYATRIPVFFRPEQSVVPTVPVYSPSPRKPDLVMERWRESFNDVIDVRSDFEPATIGQLCRVHSESYVQDVMELEVTNGFGTFDGSVVKALPYTSGSMVAAAKHAAEFGGITCSPTSGFHHAGRGYGSGFCTFNGLMLAAILLVYRCKAKVAIVDLDQHYGDGTDDIIRNFRNGEGQFIKHYTLGGHRFRDGNQALDWVGKIMSEVCDWVPDIILYQAGADSHIDDPLGGLFNDEQYQQRDYTVFNLAAIEGIPVAWNLAGGYQDPVSKVLDLHDITMREAKYALPTYRRVNEQRRRDNKYFAGLSNPINWQ